MSSRLFRPGLLVPTFLVLGCADPTGPDGRDWVAAIDVGQAGVDTPKLVMFRLDGTEMRTLASPADHAAWLPDGESLVYHTGTTEAYHLYVVGTSGSSRRLLPEDTPVPAQYYPVPAPDGQWIYFYGDGASGDGSAEPGIYRVRPDGTDLEKVSAASYASYRPFSVSPDGKTLLMERGGRLIALDVASGEIYEYGIGVSIARYSPDGRTIAFVGRLERDPGTNVYVMAADGTGIRRISSHSHSLSYGEGLAWSPDGRFVIARALGGWHRIEVETARTTLMPSWANPMSYLSWRPR